MKTILPEIQNDLISYVFIGFVVFSGIIFLQIIFIYLRFVFHKHKKTIQESPPVSVIICARNESDNLYEYLPLILEQNYSDFEVIVVNHQSTDDSKFLLSAFQRQYPHLKVIEVEKNQHLKYGKKLPLTIGIKGALHEHLLLTDADCMPNSKNWITEMSSSFCSKKEIVLGYGPIKKHKGFLNKVIRFDTVWIAINYFSFAKAGLPYMGIGRNLAYTKSVFNGVNGFKSHYSISSGDDDLFIQESAKKRNYTIQLSPDSFCYSEAPKTWKRWFNQKSRHFTTSDHYSVIKKWMLGIYPLSTQIQLISFVTLLFNDNFFWISLIIFGFTLLLKWITFGIAFHKLKESKYIAFIPLWDIFYAFLAPMMYYTIDKKDLKKW